MLTNETLLAANAILNSGSCYQIGIGQISELLDLDSAEIEPYSEVLDGVRFATFHRDNRTIELTPEGAAAAGRLLPPESTRS
jgi:hypothetical protein